MAKYYGGTTTPEEMLQAIWPQPGAILRDLTDGITIQNFSNWYRKLFKFWIQRNEPKPLRSCFCVCGMKFMS